MNARSHSHDLDRAAHSKPDTSAQTRQYRKRARAKREAETRQRIIEAAVELHESFGRQGATISAIADRAGVGRVTVYRHFSDYEAIIDACMQHYFGLNPPPHPSQWAGITDSETLVRTAIGEIYDYYLENEEMFTHGAADAVSVPFLAERMGEFGAYWGGVRDELVTRLWGKEPHPPPFVALVGLLTSFSGWQSLVRQQGLSPDEAKSTAIELIMRMRSIDTVE